VKFPTSQLSTCGDIVASTLGPGPRWWWVASFMPRSGQKYSFRHCTGGWKSHKGHMNALVRKKTPGNRNPAVGTVFQVTTLAELTIRETYWHVQKIVHRLFNPYVYPVTSLVKVSELMREIRVLQRNYLSDYWPDPMLPNSVIGRESLSLIWCDRWSWLQASSI
jgi:hypothetical protein